MGISGHVCQIRGYVLTILHLTMSCSLNILNGLYRGIYRVPISRLSKGDTGV